MNSILSSSNLMFVNSVDSLQQSLNTVETELSSGLAVSNDSDAPDQVSAILQLHANIQQNQQVQDDLNLTQSQVQSADTSLSSASTLLNQVATLAAEGLGLNESASSRQSLATQATGVLQQLVDLSNTKVDGVFVFSGDSSQNPSYAFNSATGTVTTLQTVTATQQVQDGSGGTFAVGLSANQIFDSRDSSGNVIANQNVFAAVSSVITALTNNDTAGLQTAQANLSSASSYMSDQQSFYGNVENQITSALTNTSQLSVSYQKDLSNREDADETSAIEEMQQYTTTLQAALAAKSKMPTTTLFDTMQS